MARHKGKDSIYAAAVAWRDRCLLAEGSILSEGNLWTVALLDELDLHYARNLDEGEGDFYPKLKTQLSDSSPECKQLMAECLWLLFLFPLPPSIKPATKEKRIREIWAWSGVKLEWGHPRLSNAVPENAVLEGIGLTGTAFNTWRWRELVLLINAVRDLKSHTPDKRKKLLDNPCAFLKWLRCLPGEPQKRQLTSILPHLLFPDSFERISSRGHKSRIIKHHSQILKDHDCLKNHDRTSEKSIKKWSPTEIDCALLIIRRHLEQERGVDFDYYQDERLILSKWTSADGRAGT